MGGENCISSVRVPEERMAFLLGSRRNNIPEVTNASKVYLSRAWKKLEQGVEEVTGTEWYRDLLCECGAVMGALDNAANILLGLEGTGGSPIGVKPPF